MNIRKIRRTQFLVCLGGGLLFAMVTFLLKGSYSLLSFLIYLLVGLVFSIIFFVVWAFLEKFEEPISFEDPKAQKKLLDYEISCRVPYTHKYRALIHHGKGIKQAVCESCLYFQKESLHVVCCYFGKVYFYDLPYSDIRQAYVTNNDILVILTQESAHYAYKIKQVTPDLRELLVEKGFFCGSTSHITGSIFLTDGDRGNAPYCELLYCKDVTPSAQTLEENGHPFDDTDALYIHVDDLDTFLENYGKYLLSSGKPGDGIPLQYTKSETVAILERIREDPPAGSEPLTAWLEKAASDYNGFFIRKI